VVTTLETQRLLLRQFRDDDLDEYAAICADPEVMRFLGGAALDRAESWRRIATMLGHWQLRGYGMFALEEKQSGRLLGRTGFNDPEGWPGFEIAWTLGREHWGRGFASEAARTVLAHAFAGLDRDRVISLIDPANRNSIRVAERIGERREGSVELLGSRLSVYAIRRSDR